MPPLGGGLVRISFNVEGDQQVSRAFEATAIEARDMREPLDRMADIILDAVRKQFETQGVSGLGHPWQPLEPAYAAWKLKHYGPRPILVRTGGMKGAALNKRMSVTVTRTRMVYEPKGEGGRRLYWHQVGAGDLPARKVIALTTAQKRLAVDRVFSEWLNALRRGPMWGLPGKH